MRPLSLAVRVCAIWLLVLVLGVSPAWAQSGASTIRGTVTDPQGAVVPNATVTLTNTGTNLTRSQTTTAAGTFSFELVPVGTYRIEIKAQGFRTKVVNNVQGLVGSIVDAGTQLEVGSVSETVQVEAASAAVSTNTNDATLGNTFVNQQITQLPLEARNVQSLLTLQPGVTGSPDASGYVAGARSDQSNITLDGVDINEAQSNALESPVLRLNSEAISEFRVTTVNANADQGRSSAAQINVVSKSGTNQLHGSAFYNNRSTGFTANNFFANRSGTSRPALIRNTFGGSIGGPVLRDKLFFFYAYEGRTDSSQASVAQVVPLPVLGQGNLIVQYRDCSSSTTCPTITTRTLTPADFGAVYPALVSAATPNAQNPFALSTLAAAAVAFPANDSSLGDGIHTRGFRFNAPLGVDNSNNVGTIEWNINSNQRMFARMVTQYDLTRQTPFLPTSASPDRWAHPWGGVVEHNWTPGSGSTWVNKLRYGYTRLGFSDQGDSSQNALSFRFVFSPNAFSRTLSRTTPVHNITNDTSWMRNNHTIQFGTNMRLISNGRVTFANAFDSGITNPSFYQGGGNAVSNPVRDFIRASLGQTPAICAATPANCAVLTNNSSVQNAATAIIGRLSQYSARFTFGADGSLLPAGTASDRNFATQEYDVYLQDSWKVRRNLTLTLGLRYGISRPVYETEGFEVKPTIPLNEFFEMRRQGAAAGNPVNDLLTLDLSGPANGKSPMYRWDRNNLQPTIGVAWTPQSESPWVSWLLGAPGKSVLRAGFRLANDYYGQALAVSFDLNNTLGFTSNTTISANTYNVTTRPAPVFTAFGMPIRPLQGITVPGGISFPTTQPVLTGFAGRRIESSTDEGLVAPINYLWNFTFERELPHGFVIQGSYIGRLGRDLLASRDVMALNNLVDPTSKMDWYTAATMLEQIRQTGAAPSTVGPISWFENLLPANFAQLTFDCCYNNATNLTPTQTVYFLAFDGVNGPGWGNDWTDTQDDMEFILRAGGLFSRLFFHPQYGALSTRGTIGNSNYHGAALSIRQRMRGLTWDLNYTFSHSLDDASGLQTDGTFGAAFILNPLRQRDNYADSDFDIRHQANINAIYELPFGRGRHFGGNVSRGVDAIIGGWRLSGIARWNTGLPLFAPYDDARWATNWNVQSSGTAIRPVGVCPTRGSSAAPPKLFGCNTRQAYQSFRNSYPGETGQRSPFRLPGYINIDMGLAKAFQMPWNEKHSLELRWEVFNVTNTQRFGTVDTSRTGFGLQLDPLLTDTAPPGNWSNFTAIQGSPRVMQVGARFSF